jgi:hypothetical protein
LPVPDLNERVPVFRDVCNTFAYVGTEQLEQAL